MLLYRIVYITYGMLTWSFYIYYASGNVKYTEAERHIVLFICEVSSSNIGLGTCFVSFFLFIPSVPEVNTGNFTTSSQVTPKTN
jgi:hypothetical protein